MAAEVDKMSSGVALWRWLTTIDERFVAYSLDKTDPDPNAKPADPVQKAKEFKSVVQLVQKPEVGLGFQILKYFGDNFADKIRLLSPDQIFAKLKSLEERAFRYEPSTQKVVITDPEAYHELRNSIKAIERIAFSNHEFLKAVDRPEMYRLSIWTAEALTDGDRGLIYRAEKGEITVKEFLNQVNKDYWNGLASYDGRIQLSEQPFYKRYFLMFEFANRQWSEEVVFQYSKENGNWSAE